MRLPNRPRLITVSGIAFILAMAIVFLALRQKPYDLVALSLADALLEGDTEAIGHYLFAEEVELAGYTQEKLRATWDRIIGPTLSGSKVVGTERDLSDNSGTANRVLEFPDGRTGSLQVVVYATDDGPKMLLSPHIYYAWQRRFGADGTLESGRRAILEGVNSDGAFLEDLGVKGYVDFDITAMDGPPVFSMKTWQEVRRRMEGHMGATSR
jgi:hypothetical protein